MMRFLVIAALVAGCASAGQGVTGDGQPSGPQDAPGVQDSSGPGEFQDAPHADAHLADAFVMHDAPPDAFVRRDAAPPDACVPKVTQLLVNPVFDLTPMGTGWNETPIDPMYPTITANNVAVNPQSAPYKVWEGGLTGQDEGTDFVTDIVYQDVAVPGGTTALVLTGYYIVATQETSTTIAYDTQSFDLTQTDGTVIENVMSLSNLTTTAGSTWVAFTHTFTHLPAGQTVRLRLTSTGDITNNTNFFFDTFALNATHCP